MKKYSYEILIVTLTVILPVVSAFIYSSSLPGGFSGDLSLLSIGIWVVFWGIGVRLLLAGLTQISNPDFTAKAILGGKSDGAGFIVRELGFANTAIGIAGITTLWFPYWSPAVALVGGIFLGLAGVQHLLKKKRSLKENVAMATDLFVAIVALGYAAIFIVNEMQITSFG